MRLGSICALCALLSACATPPIPLSELKPQYLQLDVVAVSAEEKIFISLGAPPGSGQTYMPVTPLPPGTTVGQAAAAGAAGGFLAGLIIAGIDSAERADANKDVEPVRQALGDIDLGGELRNAVVASLPQLSWTQIGKVTVVDAADRNALKDAVFASEAQGVLSIGTSTFLSRNADGLVFAAQALLIPVPAEDIRSRGSKRLPAPVFVAEASYEVPASIEGKRRADFLPAWANNDAAVIKTAAGKAAPKLAEMIVRILEEGKPPLQKPESGKFERRITRAYGSPYRANVNVLETDEDGELVRAEGGALRFLANPVDSDAPHDESPALLQSEETASGDYQPEELGLEEPDYTN